MLQGPGENAGVIDLGEGEAVAFKVESHNHPSAVEPFQGAATGVGGILRDIVAMGARPVALLDGLRFGAPDWSFRRAVAGIGHYGNCVGVPTVGGEAVFDAAYAGNCLVNAMCVGLLPAERVTRAGARGVGNVLVLYGATTGRDGIGGASVLASQELGEDDADKRPTVQVGDPFTGKKLIEASLELVEAGLVESLQDCGAAGLASSLAEMARDVGVDVHLDRVPLREEGMEPWEIMISESQERMVAVVRPERLAEVEAVLSRWELHHAAIGEVTETGELRAFWDDERRRRDPGRAPHRRVPALRGRPARGRAAAGRGRPGQPGAEGVDLRAIRPARPLAHGAPARARRGGAAAAAVVARARGLARRAAARLPRPARGGARGGARRGAQRRLRRRRAARADRLPQLRQPREAGDRLGAGGGDRGHRGDGRGARGFRSSRATSRSTTRPTGGRFRRRRSSGCVGLVPDVREVPRGWRPGDRVWLAEGDEVELIGWLWRNASTLSLVHDVGARRPGARAGGGLGLQRARVQRPKPSAPYGSVILAGGEPDWPQLRELGTVRLMCGVFGIRAPERDVARVTFFGLFALQHRGQESAGIAVSDHGRLTVLRDMGLVTQVFNEQKLRGLHGDTAIGHTRYSTTGSTQWANAQPLIQRGRGRTVALGHNGNLVNAADLRDELAAEGVTLGTTSDTELIAALIANDEAPLEDAVAGAMARLDGAFSVVALSNGTLIGFRDRHGFRPLCLGRGEQGEWILASETCALDLVGAELERELAPGELVLIDEDGVRTRQAVEPAEHGALCIFEFFYLARPDTRLDGVEVHGARLRMGERLAEEAPVEADLVLPIPDSGTPAAIGFSRATGIPFSEGLIKNRYVGRTFIQPDQGLREQGVKLKFNPLAEVAGKRVVAVDDSIVRGNTTRKIVEMLFEAGAAEVHVRVSAPPVDRPVLLRDRPGRRGRDDREHADGRADPRAHRRHLARLPLAGGARGLDAPAAERPLPRLPHAGLPDGSPA